MPQVIKEYKNKRTNCQQQRQKQDTRLFYIKERPPATCHMPHATYHQANSVFGFNYNCATAKLSAWTLMNAFNSFTKLSLENFLEIISNKQPDNVASGTNNK